jgi:two-component system cell cycle response regulator DivK
MPVMNGLEATRRIRRQRGLKQVPILMNSGCSEESTRELAIEAGCDDYLEEPCFFDKLMEKMAQFTALANNPNE